MRVNLLFGFLGSGKTTLAKRLLTQGPGNRKLAVIVNEFGDVGIDGAILEGRDIDMVELTSGCLCCTLKGPLLNAVEELHSKAGVDAVVIEATGVAEPEEMIETFADAKLGARYEIGPMVTVVDCAKFAKLREILGPFYEAQVANADVVILNKIDLAPAEDLEALRQAALDLNPQAEVIFAEQCAIETEDLLAGPRSRVVADFLAEGNGATGVTDHNHRHAPAQSFVLDASGEAERRRLEAFIAALPETVWRVKGFLKVDGQASLLQYTMGQLELEACDPREHYHLVFIGPDLNRETLAPAFREVFTTPRATTGELMR